MRVPLLIIGAGPFGLALSARARARGLEHVILGSPMEFWRRQMPDGMQLRSACDWHLDADGVLTIDRYLAEQGLSCDAVLPLARDRYLDYVAWFQRRADIHPVDRRVVSLDRDGHFHAQLDDGTTIEADRVVVALGFGFFRHLPDDVVGRLTAQRVTHSSDLSDFTSLRDRRVLVVGGRMAAFEWAALIAEAGAAAVDITYRHDTPAFAVSHWAWVPELLARMTCEPDWYRQRSREEKDAIVRRMWEEGRLKLEPWLEPRLQDPRITLWPNTRIEASDARAVRLDSGHEIPVDQVVLATGYKADVARLPFLRTGNCWDRLEVCDGYPALDTGFQSSVDGLFFTSILAARDFGPFFGFTVSARFSAARIIDRILEAHAGTAQRSV